MRTPFQDEVPRNKYTSENTQLKMLNSSKISTHTTNYNMITLPLLRKRLERGKHGNV